MQTLTNIVEVGLWWLVASIVVGPLLGRLIALLGGEEPRDPSNDVVGDAPNLDPGLRTRR